MYCNKCGKKLEDGQVCDCQQENNNIAQETQEDFKYEVRRTVQKEQGNLLCILSAIIYPLISIGISFFVASSMPMLLLAFVLNIGTALCFYFSGIYLIVIPLPVITFFKWGCVKHHVPLKIRIPLGILAFLLPILAIVLCAL